MKLKYIIGFCLLSITALAQNTIHESIQKEMQRTLDSLRIDDAPAPFYIGTNIVDAKAYSVKSSWGSLELAVETPINVLNHNQLFVGDYNNAGLHYSDATVDRLKGTHFRIDAELNDASISRALWLSYDDAYKYQTQKYSAKQSALEETSTAAPQHPDLVPSEAIKLASPLETKEFDQDFMVSLANKLSEVFIEYPKLRYSSVIIVGMKGNVYFDNTEGSSAHYPFSAFRLSVYGEAQTSKGETFWDQTAFCYVDESDFETESVLLEKMHQIGQDLESLCAAEDIDSEYNGPILYESQAALEVFAQMSKELKAEHKVIGGDDRAKSKYANSGKMNKMLGKRYADTNLSITARPSLKEYKGQPLLGYAPLDMEGIEAVEDFPLIQDGILVGLLNNRKPSIGLNESNGHARLDLGKIYANVSPSTIELSSKNTLSNEAIKEKLIELAKEQGLDYAIIVRKVKLTSCSPLVAYKVDLETGEEVALKGLTLSKPKSKDFKKIAYTSDNKVVYNTILSSRYSPTSLNINGSMASFISYDALLFSDMEANKSHLFRSNVPPLVSPLLLNQEK